MWYSGENWSEFSNPFHILLSLFLARRLIVGLVLQTPNEVSKVFSRALHIGLPLFQLKQWCYSQDLVVDIAAQNSQHFFSSRGENVGRSGYVRATKVAKSCLHPVCTTAGIKSWIHIMAASTRLSYLAVTSCTRMASRILGRTGARGFVRKIFTPCSSSS